MASNDSFCILVETAIATVEGATPTRFIKRVVRSYESRARAEEDMELLIEISPAAHYRIDDVPYIER